MPSLMALAQDVGFAGLSLGVEGIEGLLEPLFRRTCGYRRRSEPDRSWLAHPKEERS
jgi:hypothetical protein